MSFVWKKMNQFRFLDFAAVSIGTGRCRRCSAMLGDARHLRAADLAILKPSENLTMCWREGVGRRTLLSGFIFFFKYFLLLIFVSFFLEQQQQQREAALIFINDTCGVFFPFCLVGQIGTTVGTGAAGRTWSTNQLSASFTGSSLRATALSAGLAIKTKQKFYKKKNEWMAVSSRCPAYTFVFFFGFF